MFKIIVPEATTNLGVNPSLESNTTRWSAVGSGASIVRDNTQARFGRYSLKITTGTSALGGAYYYTAGAGISISASTSYTVSMYIYNPSDDARLAIWNNSSVELGNLQILSSSQWKRVEKTITTGTSSSIHIRVTNDNSGVSQVLYVDGILPEKKTAAGTYCDGDQDGCSWDGVEHGSTSQREAFGPGGAIKTFTNIHASLTDLDFTGMGMPPVIINQQPFAKLPGSVYEDTQVRGRVSNLMALAQGSSNLNNMHEIRQALLDAVKLDRVSQPNTFRLQYTSITNTVYADFLYEGGLEGGDRIGFSETLGLRLFAPDPYWYEDRQQVAVIDYVSNPNWNRFIRRKDGEWAFPTGTGANDYVRAIDISPSGIVYLGGAFTDFAGVSNTKRVASLVNDSITALGAGIDNGEVRAIAVGPDETAYIVGTFTAVDNGTSANRAVSYTTAGGYATMGTGLNGTARSVAVGIDGTVYVGGDFTSPATRLAKWNGSIWSSIGTGANDNVRAIAVAPDGNLFLGGAFTNFAGVATNKVAKWNVTTSAASAVGGNSQLNGACDVLAFAPDGKLYAGGAFTTASGNTVNRIAVWGGSDWLPMESGVSDSVYSMAWAQGQLWFGGAFLTTTSGLAMSNLGIWNGSTFVKTDIDLPNTGFGGTNPLVLALGGIGKTVYMGHYGTGAAEASDKTTVSNVGSASAYPIATFSGPGTLVWLENYTSGDKLYFDLEAQDGEEIEIDFRPQKKSITSNWRQYSLQPKRGSDFGTFRLLPGSNDIIAYITGGSGNTALHFRWQITHWSIDGGA